MIGGCDDPSSRARLERELPAREPGPMNKRPLAPALAEPIDELLDVLRVEAGLAPATLVAYGRDLRSTARWLEARGTRVGLRSIAHWSRNSPPCARAERRRPAARCTPTLRTLAIWRLEAASRSQRPLVVLRRPPKATGRRTGRLLAAPDTDTWRDQ